MGTRYNQLTLEERCDIAALRRAGKSIRQIAAALDRAPSSISRELRRNGCRQAVGERRPAGSQLAGYRPAFAHQQARARRWSGSRLDRDSELRAKVLDHLGKGWSPAEVCGRLALEHRRPVIGCETIYRFIYAQLKRTKDGRWRHYLPRAKGRRGRRRSTRSRSPALAIKLRLPIDRRPQEALDRCQAGHWEADFMLFSRLGQSILVLHERTSRFTAIVRTRNRRAQPTAGTIAQFFSRIPPQLRRSLTFDNGTEFAEHHRLHKTSDLQTFFCDPHSPWQKGGIENAIGRFRRFLPRNTDLHALKPKDIASFLHAYNHTPRKCLDFHTPAEVFSNLLHFKRESTPSLRSG
jgi:IS30 family transposase